MGLARVTSTFLRPVLVAVLPALMTAGCAFFMPVLPPVPEPVVRVPEDLSPPQWANRILTHLETGNEAAARADLADMQRAHPQDRRTRIITNTLDGDPVALFGRGQFRHRVAPGETLSEIASRYLGNPAYFYLLARVNGVAVPRDIQSDQVLNIPGRRRAQPPPEVAGLPDTGEALLEGEPLLDGDPATDADGPVLAALPPSAGTLPRNGPARDAFEEGERRLASGDFEGALIAYERASDLAPGAPEPGSAITIVRPMLANRWYARGLAALRQEKPVEAVVWFDRVIDIDPSHIEARRYRSEAQRLISALGEG